MQKLFRYLMLGIALQGSAFALTSEADFLNQRGSEVTMLSESENTEAAVIVKERRRPNSHENDHKPFNEYASFFLTVGGTIPEGNNLIFNTKVALSGIGYNTTTGVFTLGPGTYSIIYFYIPYNPVCNVFINNQLILNGGLAGGSTVVTLTEPINTLEVVALTEAILSSPNPNQSLASIAISRIH